MPAAVAWIVCLAAVLVMPASARPVPAIQKQANGVVMPVPSGVIRLQVWSDRIIRVSYTPESVLPETRSLSVIARPAKTSWTLSQSLEAVVVQTHALRARVDRKTGAVSFQNLQGKLILEETANGRQLAPAAVANVSGKSVQDAFVLQPDEQIYGLGQHQNGRMSYRGTAIRLLQENRVVSVPVLVSSKGYGVLWDNPAVTDVEVGVKGRENEVRWTSEVGAMLDYYFLYGPTADQVVQGYRNLTGPSPMLPKWAWGFWQCKERYTTQSEVLDVVSRYRQSGVPLDGVIQDWQYWSQGGWGSHEFDSSRYPDPQGMVKALHDLNTHVLISVWPRFDLGLANAAELDRAGALFPAVLPNVYPEGKGRWYDPYKAEGRQIYWKQISDRLFKLGFDGWWLDASEGEFGGKWGEFRDFNTGAGRGATVYNAYPLMHTTGVYEGQRGQTQQKRAVILTRSAYAGQQRNAAITWSGDIQGTWEVFKQQMPAGLNFSLTGIPYWNTDIGGFFGGKPSDPHYQELFTRWFQFGAFTPMFRVHGTGDGKEFWRWDGPTQRIWQDYARLRYRLLPYIYSVSWQVTNAGGTMMRPLIMDFAQDAKALDIGDQYLFGPAIMVNPVTDKGANKRTVYLPGKAAWYDFWTGRREQGGQSLQADAPIQTMPLFVAAGSILPLGPSLQYSSEKSADPIELRVYRGADGAFTLYEDEGDNYSYEKGVYATIPIRWNEAAGTLTIGARKGTFPGMLTQRTFHVVFVREGHGSGVGETDAPDETVRYEGKALTIRARQLRARAQ